MQVGSGKSSLLNALMGELAIVEGELCVDAPRIGYVAQTVPLMEISSLSLLHTAVTSLSTALCVCVRVNAVLDPEHVGAR